MLIQEIREIKSGKRELRQFGLTVGIVLALIGGWFLFRHKTYWVPFVSVGGALVLAGLVAPIVLLPFQKIWMALAVVLGWVMSRLLLILLFYLVVTPIGLTGRLMGHPFLEKGFRTEAGTYWVRRKTKTERQACERQF